MPYEQLHRSALNLKPLSERKDKVHIERDHVPATAEPAKFSAAGQAVIDETVERLKKARDAGKARMLTFGAHAIKNGLAPVRPRKGALPKPLSFLEVTGRNLQLTSFKRAEDRKDSYIVRVFNPSGKPVNGMLRLWKPVKKAWGTNLNEEREQDLAVSGKIIPLKVPEKKIVSVEFMLKGR